MAHIAPLLRSNILKMCSLQRSLKLIWMYPLAFELEACIGKSIMGNWIKRLSVRIVDLFADWNSSSRDIKSLVLHKWLSQNCAAGLTYIITERLISKFEEKESHTWQSATTNCQHSRRNDKHSLLLTAFNIEQLHVL